MPVDSRSTVRNFGKLLSLLCFWISSALNAQPIEPSYAIGTIATDIPAVMVRRMEPLTQYLSAQLNTPIHLRPAPSFSAAIADFGKGITQIAYLTPVAFLEARERSARCRSHCP